jgi:hypothetical protein
MRLQMARGIALQHGIEVRQHPTCSTLDVAGALA